MIFGSDIGSDIITPNYHSVNITFPYEILILERCPCGKLRDVFGSAVDMRKLLRGAPWSVTCRNSNIPYELVMVFGVSSIRVAGAPSNPRGSWWVTCHLRPMCRIITFPYETLMFLRCVLLANYDISFVLLSTCVDVQSCWCLQETALFHREY